MHFGVQARVQEEPKRGSYSWLIADSQKSLGWICRANPLDSRVAEAEGIIRNPWSVFAMGFLLQETGERKLLMERRDDDDFREIV
jgi:hypothetical protein